ncbi:hypothetical protein OUZ56_012948 [Daphnia magna]|uniref:CxC3 like cysteine cluster domain-containing protein n=1 Tax=Daphnia magna TaxID=35525 RepID=A0ABQ9Z4I9_9CRUS|nr:hypothetical protein OUZ56_012948 [Daphnia magna]
MPRPDYTCDCKNHLYPDYDVKIRSTRPFHDRRLFMNEFESRPLLTHEFYGVENRPLIRCRTEKCKKLGKKGTLALVAGTKHSTVISGEGRLHLHCASFKCSRCDGVMNAELEDYIGSGYWPGNPKTLGIFFATSLLKLYFHLKNYLPGSSEYCSANVFCRLAPDAKRCKCAMSMDFATLAGCQRTQKPIYDRPEGQYNVELGAFSADAGRENTISNEFREPAGCTVSYTKILLAGSRREGRRGDGLIRQGWATTTIHHLTDLQHYIQKGYTYAIDNDVNIHRQLEHKLNCFDRDIKQQRKLSCRACSNKCCAVHIDGNHKLVRRQSKLKFVCRLKRLHACASSFERYYQDEEVQFGDGTLFTEAVESENDSDDEDVTDEDVTDE